MSDQWTEGWAKCIGCTKVWMMFPWKPNIKLWAQYNGTTNQLREYGERLKGGIIVRTSQNKEDDGNCLRMPPGTIHAVFGTVGGFLVGSNAMNATDIPLAGYGIGLQLARKQDTEQIEGDINWFEAIIRDTIEKAHSMIPTALYHLNILLDRCDHFAGRRQDPIWKRIDECKTNTWSMRGKGLRRVGKSYICTCGKSFNDFRKHYTRDQCSDIVKGEGNIAEDDIYG